MSASCRSLDIVEEYESSSRSPQGISLTNRFLSIFDPFLRLATSHPKGWFLLLMSLGLGWLFATCLTALGMYMVACSRIQHNRVHFPREYHEHQPCFANWSAGNAHLILIVGAVINVMILIGMLLLLLHEKIVQTARNDPPPDYETLIKSETPPPTYGDLDMEAQPVHGSEANTLPMAVPTDPSTICRSGSIIQDSQSTALSSHPGMSSSSDASDPPPSYSEVVFLLSPPTPEVMTEFSIKYTPLQNVTT